VLTEMRLLLIWTPDRVPDSQFRLDPPQYLDPGPFADRTQPTIDPEPQLARGDTRCRGYRE
jgi:hypothetical protein